MILYLNLPRPLRAAVEAKMQQEGLSWQWLIHQLLAEWINPTGRTPVGRRSGR